MSYITRDSEWWVSQFTAARLLRAPLAPGGLLEWSARAVDALLLLETEAYATKINAKVPPSSANNVPG